MSLEQVQSYVTEQSNVEYDHTDLVDTLAQHRTNNTKMPELEAVFYKSQYDKLDEYSDEELVQLIKQEINYA